MSPSRYQHGRGKGGQERVFLRVDNRAAVPYKIHDVQIPVGGSRRVDLPADFLDPLWVQLANDFHARTVDLFIVGEESSLFNAVIHLLFRGHKRREEQIANPTQTLLDLAAIDDARRFDKQLRLVEDSGAVWRYDGGSLAAPGSQVVLPADLGLLDPGRWIMVAGGGGGGGGGTQLAEADVTPATVTAGTNVRGGVNLDATMPDYSSLVFSTHVEVRVNGVIQRNGASFDVYPGDDPTQGDLKFTYKLRGGSKPDRVSVRLFT